MSDDADPEPDADGADSEPNADGADSEPNADGAADPDADDWFDQALKDAEYDEEELFSGEWSPDADAGDADSTADDADTGTGDADADVDAGDVADAETGDDSDDPSENAAFDQGADDLESAFADIADEDAEFDEDAFADISDDDADAFASDEFDDLPGETDFADATDDGPADPTNATDDGADPGVASDGDDGGLFDEDFASALGDAPDLPGDGGGDAGPTGGFGGGGGEFDMATDDAGALGDMGGVGSPGGDFEQEDDYESSIPRIELGVDGLDAMIQGGVPERALMVAIGSAGTGKTTLGLQFLRRGLDQGERAVYITLEESRERVIRSATEKGFAFDEYAEDGRLAVVDIDPVEMANSLQSIRSELPRLIDEFGASRLVLDSVSLLEMMYDDRATRRNEIYDFTKSLKEAGVTTLLTSEASEDSSYASRHGIVEYLTDAVFVLQYVRPSDFRETRLAIEIQKIRDANHSRETKPYEITNEGISVYRQANIF